MKKGRIKKWGYGMLKITSRLWQASSVALTSFCLAYPWGNKHLFEGTEQLSRTGAALFDAVRNRTANVTLLGLGPY